MQYVYSVFVFQAMSLPAFDRTSLFVIHEVLSTPVVNDDVREAVVCASEAVSNVTS